MEIVLFQNLVDFSFLFGAKGSKACGNRPKLDVVNAKVNTKGSPKLESLIPIKLIEFIVKTFPFFISCRVLEPYAVKTASTVLREVFSFFKFN